MVARGRGRIQRRMEATRERILHTALDLFLRKGLEQTTIAEIAEAADVARGTFFNYFPTKEAIFNYLGRHLLERMVASLPPPGTERRPAKERLVEFFLPACAWHAANPALSRFAYQVFVRDSAVLEAEESNLGPLFEMLAALVRDGQRSGELSPDFEAEDAATLLFGAYFSALRSWHVDGNERPLGEMMRSLVHLVIRGLEP